MPAEIALSLNEAKMLSGAGKAAMHRAHNAEQTGEHPRVLAQRRRVLVQDIPMLGLNALDIGDIAADQPELLRDRVCGFVRHN